MMATWPLHHNGQSTSLGHSSSSPLHPNVAHFLSSLFSVPVRRGIFSRVRLHHLFSILQLCPCHRPRFQLPTPHLDSVPLPLSLPLPYSSFVPLMTHPIDAEALPPSACVPSVPNTSPAPSPSALEAALLESSTLVPTHSLLSDKAILHNLALGRVIISPFDLSHLSTSSYDVTLGPHYYRESTPEPGCGIYNPYSRDQVTRVWGEARQAELHSEWIHRTAQSPLSNISLDDRLIWIAPGETILGHTQEFIGGLHSITTMMKARSSMGRNFIETCKCAGWGDIGYTNRWTMEITNNRYTPHASPCHSFHSGRHFRSCPLTPNPSSPDILDSSSLPH